MGRISKTLALSLTLIIVISCLTLLIVKPANTQSTTTRDEHTTPYVESYISGPWSQSIDSTSEGYTAGNIILVNPTSNSFNGVTLTIQVDNSDVVTPSMRLWDSNYTLNSPKTFFESGLLFEDLQNFSTPITSINIGPNQKETISIGIPSSNLFQFNSHSLKIYVSQSSFGDIINGQSMTVPQSEAYLQIVNFDAIESDNGTYHEYYNSTLKSEMVTVAYNPNFYQRYWNISKHDIYSDNFGIMHYMGSLDSTYFNVTVFNNNTFPISSITLFGQTTRLGSHVNYWRALMDYVMQPSETYLFPVKSTEHPSSAYATGYIANNSESATPTPSVPEFPSGTLLLLLTAVTSTSLLVYHKKHKSKTV